MQEVLGYVEAGNMLPPMVVLQALAKNPHLTLAVVKGYIERQLTQVQCASQLCWPSGASPDSPCLQPSRACT